MATRRWWRLPPELRREIIRLAAKGATYKEVCEQTGGVDRVVGRGLVPLGGVIRPEDYQPRPGRLSRDDRVAILLGLERGLSYRHIGEVVGKHASSICREVNNNGGRRRYRPMDAHRRAAHQA